MQCCTGAQRPAIAPAIRRTARAPRPSRKAQRQLTVAEAGKSGGGFWAGFALGGVVCGAAGFFFAPQISRAVLDEQRKFRMPKWLEEDKPPVTKEELEEKINQLHSAINEVASSIGSDDGMSSARSNGSKPMDAVAQ